MFHKLKVKISQKIHNNFYSHFINLKNKKVLEKFNTIINDNSIKSNKFNKLLIDGGFNNLGYFYRLQLFRAAVRSKKIEEKAFIWDCNYKICKFLLISLGIKDITYLIKGFKREIYKDAERLARNIKTKEDILNISLPFNVPGSFLYDVILKMQRLPSVDLKDKNLKKYIYKYLYSIDFSKNILESFKPDLVVMSHCISYQCSPLAWLSSQQKIPVIILAGDFGIPRFWKILNSKDIYFGFGHPQNKDLNSLSNKKQLQIIKTGSKYIRNRISGQSSDIGGRFAFQGKNKNFEIIKNVKNQKKIIAIYSNTFYDYPHTFGMTRFVDVKDWIITTINKASKNKNVIWLIKPHPMDQWYGGITLKDILPEKLPSNIILLNYDYSGKDILEKSDALITHHGTAAIEFAAMGKPVLVTDKGWFHDCGFVKFPKSKDEYLKLIMNKWYESINLEKAKFKARLFAGMFFGIPLWQKKLVIPDDADTKKLRENLPEIISKNKRLINKEIKLIRNWLDTDTNCYHTYKILNSKNFTTVIKD